MINLTPAFKQKLFNDERDYLEYADITLENNTVLHLTNANFWQNGFSIEDSIGEDNTFSALGAAVVNSCTLVINNIYDDFTEYDFTNAKVVVSVGMELPNPQDPSTTYIDRAWKGTFMVDEATYNGSIVTLKCLDDMAQFDRPYSESTLTYPTTLAAIVRDACAECLGSADLLGTQRFPHYDYEIQNRPEEENTTFREVISWCAAIACCFARFAYNETVHNSVLELKWFNTQVFEDRAEGTDGGEFDTNSTTHYTTGDTLDGGTFNPWSTGDVADAGNFTDERPFHHISSLYNHNIGVDDIVITGISVTIKVEIVDDDTTKSELDKRLVGTEGYVIDIGQNEFITETNVNEILTWLGQQLIGLTFRKASVTHPSDPSIEAGDIAFVYDRKGNEYPILVTRTVFNGFGTQTTVCGAETPNRNSGTRYSEITKSYVELRKKVKERAGDTFAKAMEALQEGLDNASGLYVTEVPQTGGGVITFLHNKPNPTAAQGIFEFPSDSNIVIMVSSAGIVVTNEGDTGGQNIGDRNWYGLQVDGTLIATILNTIGVNADWINAGSVSADYINGGTLTLGGNNNVNGILRVLDSQGNQVGLWNNEGATIIGDLILKRKSYTNSTYMIAEIGGVAAGNANNYANLGGSTHYGLHIYDTASDRNGNLYLLASPWSGGTYAGDSLIGSSGRLTLYSHLTSSVLNESWMSFDQNGIHMNGGLASSDSYALGLDNTGFYIGYQEGSTGHARNPIFKVTGTSSLYARVDAYLGAYYGNSFNQTSDIRKKEDIRDIGKQYLESIGRVKLIQFKFKTRSDEKIQFGITAQNLMDEYKNSSVEDDVFPIVDYNTDKDGDTYFSVNYTQFLIVRIAYDEQLIQGQKKQLDAQQDEINDLKSRIEKLEKLVDQLL